jgi:hypothetical protein
LEDDGRRHQLGTDHDGSVFGTGSVGAIGLSDSDPNTIYVGMGESPIRGNVSHGDGVYKSTTPARPGSASVSKTRDRFRAFACIRRIRTSFTSRRRATFGDPNEQRGVFRSKDGGKTWEKVFYRGRQGRRDRSDSRSDESEHSLRRLLGSLSQALDARERRPGRRHLQID